MKSADGQDAENILFGSTLASDPFARRTFDYQIANPPYGNDWKMDREAVEAEAERGDAGRFGAGLPRISDGQLLFLQHMVAHMRPASEGGGRVAIIMNGSPLFTGDAGGGESEIRRWIMENDLLEALVALPEQLFYNTGIATYVWVLSNYKPKARRSKVLLVDATAFWTPMRKSLGSKRREVPAEKAAEILKLLGEFKDGEYCRVYPTTHFAYRKVTVERPLRLNFHAGAERIARLDAQGVFAALAMSTKKDAKARAAEEAEGRAEQAAIRAMLGGLPGALFKDRTKFVAVLDKAMRASKLTITAPVRKAILAALSERDETAEICRDASGDPEADPELRDFENVPFGEDIEAYMAREVTPFVPDAWVNESVQDHKDGKVGRVGYEINFNRYFYHYMPPRPLEEIERDIKSLENEILESLRGITE
jgi:type I restriction enzyme M protein